MSIRDALVDLGVKLAPKSVAAELHRQGYTEGYHDRVFEERRTDDTEDRARAMQVATHLERLNREVLRYVKMSGFPMLTPKEIHQEMVGVHVSILTAARCLRPLHGQYIVSETLDNPVSHLSPPRKAPEALQDMLPNGVQVGGGAKDHLFKREEED